MQWTVVLTGVSRGLGAAMFDWLYARGDRLVGIGRRFTEAQAKLAAAEPDRVVLREADLAEPGTLPDRDELAPWLTGAGPVALVHNAAVVEPIGAIGQLPPDQLARAVAINLTAPMLLTNAFVGALPTTAEATVLFMSSGAAHRQIGGWSGYCTTKRGGEFFFEGLAAQEADRIRVASINPGGLDTGMQVEIRHAAGQERWFPDRDWYVTRYADGALADPAEVAETILAAHLPASAARLPASSAHD